MCPNFLLASNGSSELLPGCTSCRRCTQVEELLSVTAELLEEVGRLRSIEEPVKRSADGVIFHHSRDRCVNIFTCDTKDPLFSLHQIESGGLRDKGEQKPVSAWGWQVNPLSPTLSSQLLLHKKCVTLELEGHRSNDVDDDPSRLEQSPWASHPHIMATSIEKKQDVVIGDFLLRNTTHRGCAASLWAW